MKPALAKTSLLIFAHRGEAQAFLKKGEWTVLPGPGEIFQGTIAGRPHLILITGEGKELALARTSALIARMPELSCAVNFGVAGALRESLEKDQLVTIRTVYGEDQFHSFELAGEFDLITAKKRVQDLEVAQHLKAFAPVVDRELWAIAFACRELAVPLTAIKYISDDAQDLEAGREICQPVRELAPMASEALKDFYLSLLDQQQDDTEQTAPSLFDDPLGLLSDRRFHFSATQKRQYLRDLEKLDPEQREQLRDKVDAALELSRPKDRSRFMLELIRDTLSPIEARVRKRLQHIQEQFHAAGAQLSYDPKFEDLRVRLSLELAPSDTLSERLNKLSPLELSPIWRLLSGEVDDV